MFVGKYQENESKEEKNKNKNKISNSNNNDNNNNNNNNNNNVVRWPFQPKWWFGRETFPHVWSLNKTFGWHTCTRRCWWYLTCICAIGSKLQILFPYDRDRDGHQPKSVGVYIPTIPGFLFWRWHEFIPNIGSWMVVGGMWALPISVRADPRRWERRRHRAKAKLKSMKLYKQVERRAKTLRIQNYPDISWGWDWIPQYHSREGFGFLGKVEFLHEDFFTGSSDRFLLRSD